MEINNLFNNENIKKTDEKGCFSVFEYQEDFSVEPQDALFSYYMQEMNVKKRQVLCKLDDNCVKVQAGAMQWMAGNIEMVSGIKGLGNLIGNKIKSSVTKESAVKPLYKGNGYVMLEPTYRYLFVEDVSTWGSGMVLDDGMFLACDANLKESITHRKTISSALLGGAGFFNLCLSGDGFCVLESSVPRQELIEFNLVDDVVKIDGNMAIAWSSSLDFTVERSGKTLIGSGLSGEGLVNVYRGTGKILMAPVVNGTVHDDDTEGPKEKKATTSQGLASSFGKSMKL